MRSYKSYSKVFLVTCVLLILSIGSLFAESYDVNNSKVNNQEINKLAGNNGGNICNGGIVSKDFKNNIYYLANTGEFKGIYSYISGVDEKTLLVNHNAEYLNYADGQLYYVNLDDNYSIYKYNLVAGMSQKIFDGDAQFLNYHSGFLYFRNNTDNGYLYKMDVTNLNKEIVYNSKVSNLALTEDYMFFIDEANNGNVYFASLADETFRLISNEGGNNMLYCTDESLYYGQDYFEYKYDVNSGSSIEVESDIFGSMGYSLTPAKFGAKCAVELYDKLYYAIDEGISSLEYHNDYYVKFIPKYKGEASNLQTFYDEYYDQEIMFFKDGTGNIVKIVQGDLEMWRAISDFVFVYDYEFMNNCLYYVNDDDLCRYDTLLSTVEIIASDVGSVFYISDNRYYYTSKDGMSVYSLDFGSARPKELFTVTSKVKQLTEVNNEIYYAISDGVYCRKINDIDFSDRIIKFSSGVSLDDGFFTEDNWYFIKKPSNYMLGSSMLTRYDLNEFEAEEYNNFKPMICKNEEYIFTVTKDEEINYNDYGGIVAIRISDGSTKNIGNLSHVSEIKYADERYIHYDKYESGDYRFDMITEEEEFWGIFLRMYILQVMDIFTLQTLSIVD